MGGGDSWVVRAPDTWSKGLWFESQQKWQEENFLLQCQLSVLTLISVSVPLPCYHSSTYKNTYFSLTSQNICKCFRVMALFQATNIQVIHQQTIGNGIIFISSQVPLIWPVRNCGFWWERKHKIWERPINFRQTNKLNMQHSVLSPTGKVCKPAAKEFLLSSLTYYFS